MVVLFKPISQGADTSVGVHNLCRANFLLALLEGGANLVHVGDIRLGPSRSAGISNVPPYAGAANSILTRHWP